MAFISSKSFDGKHEVVYDGRPTAKQRYKLNGKAVVGVTTMVKAGLPTPEPLQGWKIGKGAEYVWDQFMLDERAAKVDMVKAAKTAWKSDLEAAAGIGVIVHDYAELVSLKKHEAALEMLAKHEGSEHWGGILSAIHKVDEFNKDNKDEIIATETIVGSPNYGFAGRFDRLVRRNGVVIISDYKTSGGFYVEQFIQDAAYSIAISEWMNLKVEGFEVIRFAKDGGDYQQLLISDKDEIKMLQDQALRCLETYQCLKKFNNDKRFAYGGKK